MAPAVADPLLMGYKALYKTMLEDSKRGIARAMRVFATAENFPVLVHCVRPGFAPVYSLLIYAVTALQLAALPCCS